MLEVKRTGIGEIKERIKNIVVGEGRYRLSRKKRAGAKSKGGGGYRGRCFYSVK